MALTSLELEDFAADPSLLETAQRIDEARLAMESDMIAVREKCKTYLNWYSPPYDTRLQAHDAWPDPFLAQDVGLTRATFPIARAVIEIWAALEAAKPPTLWAEPDRVPPPPMSLDQAEVQRGMMVVGAFKQVAALKSTMRAQLVRDYMRRDNFALNNFVGTRRKDLYGFSWTKVWPHPTARRPVSHVLRNPTTVYPLWSDRSPGETEAVLVAYQMSATQANAKYRLGIPLRNGAIVAGRDSGIYQQIDEKYYDSSRTMVWVEEYWWRDLEYDSNHFVTRGDVSCVVRVGGKVIEKREYPGWTKLPWVYYENTDERDAYGWSDIAGVIDINDEFNRRLSQEGDIIGSYSAPRFQLLNSFNGRDVEMPGPFEMISLQDQEKIEQILTRIDTFPAQQHFNILTDLLHRVSGLPPITWGLIANAQTSGRALSASWKATEARLAPKLLRTERSLDDYLELCLMYAERYNWHGAKELYALDDSSDRAERFRDFRWEFPPMEPRDFMEVTQDAITKRDAGLQTTLQSIRATGDEAAEDTLEAVMAEYLNVFLHADKVQAFLLAQRAELDNIQFAQQLGVEIAPGGGGPQSGAINPATVANAVGLARQTQIAAQNPPAGAAPGTLPPTQAGAPGNAGTTNPAGGAPVSPGAGGGAPGEQLSSGTLLRNGDVSNQLVQTRRY